MTYSIHLERKYTPKSLENLTAASHENDRHLPNEGHNTNDDTSIDSIKSSKNKKTSSKKTEEPSKYK